MSSASLTVITQDIFWVSYSLIFVTIFGSLFSFVIFSRRPFQRQSIGVYGKCLAILDLSNTPTLVVNIVSAIINVKLTTTNETICKVLYFLSVGISPLPGWVLVLFSIDQLITTLNTKHFGFIKKKWFQYGIVIVFFLAHCVLYYPTIFYSGFFNYTVADNVSVVICDSGTSYLSYIYLFEANLIPFAIMVVTTSLIIRELVKSRNRILDTTTKSTTMAAAVITTDRRVSVMRARNLKFGFNSVILNVIFIIFVMPVVISNIIPKPNYYTYNLIRSITYTLFYLNFALHFWIHLFVNSVFRNEVLVIFRLRKRTLFNTTLTRPQ